MNWKPLYKKYNENQLDRDTLAYFLIQSYLRPYFKGMLTEGQEHDYKCAQSNQQTQLWNRKRNRKRIYITQPGLIRMQKKKYRTHPAHNTRKKQEFYLDIAKNGTDICHWVNTARHYDMGLVITNHGTLDDLIYSLDKGYIPTIHKQDSTKEEAIAYAKEKLEKRLRYCKKHNLNCKRPRKFNLEDDGHYMSVFGYDEERDLVIAWDPGHIGGRVDKDNKKIKTRIIHKGSPKIYSSKEFEKRWKDYLHNNITYLIMFYDKNDKELKKHFAGRARFY